MNGTGTVEVSAEASGSARWVLVVEVAGEEFALELAGGQNRPVDRLVAGQVAGAPPRVDLRSALGFSPRGALGRTVRARIAAAGVVELVVDRVCEVMQVTEDLVTPAGDERVLQLDDRTIRVLSARALAGPDSLAA